MDLDGGWEDVAALAMLLRSPDLRVMGVGVTPGITNAAETRRRVELLLRDLSVRNVGMVEEFPAGADILATGPLTRVGRMIGAGKRPRCVTWMGGALRVKGNAGGGAEWNAAADAEALRVVLASGVEMMICPLDLTNLFAARAGVVELVGTDVQRELKAAYGEKERYWWDELAAGYLCAPGLYRVEEREVEWRRGGRLVEKVGGRRVKVLVGCERAGFEGLLGRSLRY
jgi:purine nucleosidase